MLGFLRIVIVIVIVILIENETWIPLRPNRAL